jgi:ribosomal protein L19
MNIPNLESELLLKRLIKKIKLNNTYYSKKKITIINFFHKQVKPGMLLYLVLKPKLNIKNEHVSGICIARKKRNLQSSMYILNVTINMKILNIFLNASPLIFLCIPIFKRKYLYTSYFKLNLTKLYYLNELKIKYLRTNIITKTVLS